MQDTKLKGNIYILLTALCLSLSTVFTHQIVQNINPIVFAFFSFIWVTVLLFVLRISFLGGYTNLFSILKTSYKSFIFVNLTSALDWILFLIALKYINGSFVNSIVFGVTPIAALISTRSFTKIRCLFSGIILVLLVLIGMNYIHIEKIHNFHFGLAIFYSTLAGIAVGVGTVFLKNLSNEGVKVIDAILFRYIGIIAVTAIIIIYKHDSLDISLVNIGKIAGISLLFILMPAYFVQKGIAYISSFNTAVISSSIPAITYIIGAALSLRFDLIQTITIMCLSLALILYSRLSAGDGG